MNITALLKTATVLPLIAMLALAGCGGGGGGSTAGSPQTPGGGTPSTMPAFAALAGVASNHGLSAMDMFTVPAGVTAEHGNVEFSCPAGGPDCMVRVASDGSVEYERTGGIPSTMSAFATLAGVASNHGLSAMDMFTVPAGVTAEHGNVEFSCPAGGPDCMVRVASDGSVEYERTGGIPSTMSAFATLAGVASNHGLSAMDMFTVPAGVTAEHGNVEFSCPAGGPDCMVRVASDGSVEYERTGGIPSTGFAFAALAGVASNHGLSAMDMFTVPAGVTAEHGNVEFSCPAGGPDCMVRVASDGSVEYERTGGIPSTMSAFATLAGVASNHGLSAMDMFTVPAGVTAEHGNVEFSCPAGGPDCMVRVASDGSVEYERTGGIPLTMAILTVSLSALAQITDSLHNPTAEDLLDHWNDPAVLQGALGTTALNHTDTSARISTLESIFQVSKDQSDPSLALLRNVDPDDISVIGERDGITYGQWTGGPAGGLNIEFDWRFAEAFDADARARMERAGKSWSWRILDDFGTHTLAKGFEHHYRNEDTGQHETVVTDEDLLAGDLLILVVKNGEAGNASATRYGFGRETTETDYEPWFGVIELPQDRHNQTSTMAHEIAHILGMGNRSQPSVARYNDIQLNAFVGPEAMKANGNNPVPFQWYYPGQKPSANMPVTPGSPGAQVDRGHLNVCTSIMAYCRDRTVTYGPSELDFGYLADIGYEIRDAQTASEPEIYGYGAWGDYSAWGVGVERTIRYESGDPNVILSQTGIIVDAYDDFRAGADAFGISPETELGDAQQTMGGNATWTGSLLGVDLGQAMLPPVFGRAELNIDLVDLSGTARFDDLTVVIDGTRSTFRRSQIEYAVDIDGNTFTDGDGRIAGGIFGPAHEEMAGVLYDLRQEVNLVAGFGGKR